MQYYFSSEIVIFILVLIQLGLIIFVFIQFSFFWKAFFLVLIQFSFVKIKSFSFLFSSSSWQSIICYSSHKHLKIKTAVLILFIQTLALYKSFTYLLTYLLTIRSDEATLIKFDSS